MYEKPKLRNTGLDRNVSKEGEHLHTKIERMTKQKEKISPSDSAPLIFTDRREGVRPNTDIRTDRFEQAIIAGDKIARGYAAKSAENGKAKGKGDGKTESTDGKGGNQPTTETPKT